MGRNLQRLFLASFLTGISTIILIYYFDLSNSNLISSLKVQIKKENLKLHSKIKGNKILEKTSTALETSTTKKISTTSKQEEKTFTLDEYFNYTIVADGRNQSINGTKHILFYTSLWSEVNWWMSSQTVTKDSPELKNCPINSCVFTSNRTYLGNILDYDAIFIHISQQFWNIQDHMKPIEARSPNQLYFLVSQEAPALFSVDYKNHANIFNATLTYRLDSDIVWTYGKIIDIKSGKVVAPANSVDWIQPNENYQDDAIQLIIRNKTKTAAWITSRCNPPSKRNVLAEKLKSKIDIDVYGYCGTMKCAPFPKQCFDYDATYKFYFAFENSLCKDYITEKTFKVLGHFIVPVIFSGADLSKFLPPKSYIDANAFNTTEDLGNYLKFLSENPKEYVKYFWWKKHYRTTLTPPELIDVCDICQKLHDPNLLPKPHIIPNIEDWFNKDMCTAPKIKF